jgi:colicin import membrane protein
VAAIRPNIVFTDLAPGNPRAEVEVRALPDGSITSVRLRQSSGLASWDNAVLRAIERTGRLPPDENGRIPSTIILGFRPQD